MSLSSSSSLFSCKQRFHESQNVTRLSIIIVVVILTWVFREQIKEKFAKKPVDYDPAEGRGSITPPPAYPASRLNSGVSLVGGTLKRENGGTMRSDSGNARLIVRDESDYVDTGQFTSRI